MVDFSGAYQAALGMQKQADSVAQRLEKEGFQTQAEYMRNVNDSLKAFIDSLEAPVDMGYDEAAGWLIAYPTSEARAIARAARKI